ncbi:hypothetical protein [Nocardioides perillae]|uniref:Uncharacterized protein n=1 Tax=Nocardioides perillae TaxID=1119534 RepID=A0A7Y9RXX9_9ACTN|nr:hypothetical protein [Nocardioides perillae]NYG56618.1 hypothetical protein [Nocardioides perillae]
MTWTSYHRRGDVLRTVVERADQRRDGILPTDVAGVSETFRDDLDLLGALSLKWHTRLAGRIEGELASQPLDLEAAVVRAWQSTARDLAGVRSVLDRALAAHPDPDVVAALEKAAAKEHVLLALMAGRSSTADDVAARVGRAIAERARDTLVAQPEVSVTRHQPRVIDHLLHRLRTLAA